MTSPPLPFWQTLDTDAVFNDPRDCARQATRFERQIRRRNIIEYAVGAVMLLAFGSFGIAAGAYGEWTIAGAMALTVAGIAVLLWNLKQRASNLERRPEDPCAAHLRRQYARQHEALRAVPLWYIGPLVPGIVAFYAAVTARLAEAVGWARALEGLIWPASVTFGLLGIVALANWIAARALSRKIAQLDALTGKPRD